MSERHDVVIVGAGAAGLYMLHTARKQGLDAIVLERGAAIGGTWYWNRYPGARCDVESFDYSYSFDDDLQQEWTWSEKYSAQPEILAYLNHVADRFSLRDGIRLDTNVTGAEFDEATGTWRVDIEGGEPIEATYVVMATGVLSTPKTPEFAGLDTFEGRVIMTNEWPDEEVDFSGKRVAVIGTGSTGIQVVPIIAEQARELLVFQRTPSYSLPAHNRPLTDEDHRHVKSNYAAFRERARRSPLGAYTESHGKATTEVTAEEREAEYWRNYDYGSPMRFASSFTDLVIDDEANATARDFVAARIRERVRDSSLHDALIPTTYALAIRRLCIDTGYYETFDRDNVALIDLYAEPLQEITPTGVRTARGDYDVDVLVLATGFDAVTGTLRRLDIRGRGGATLRDVWDEAPVSYLGVAVAGFPNLFTVTGPGSPSVTSNMFVSIEQHIEFIGGLLERAGAAPGTIVEATDAAQREWVAHVNEVGDSTLYRDATSWYVGANVPGKPRALLQYVGGVHAYGDKLAAVEAGDYEGFEFTKAAEPVAAAQGGAA